MCLSEQTKVCDVCIVLYLKTKLLTFTTHTNYHFGCTILSLPTFKPVPSLLGVSFRYTNHYSNGLLNGLNIGCIYSPSV